MSDTEIVASIILTTLLILLLIAGVTISFFIASRQRSKQQVELAQARLTYEMELRQVETEVSEHLMQQFAQELHDNIGHILTCIRLEVENKKLDHPGLDKILNPVETYLDDASHQLRLLSRSLNTDYISNVGLDNAIQIEVERQKQLKKFDVHYEHNYFQSSLDKNQELMAFRIFQEVTQNAMRHSKAKNLYVSLKSSPDFELCVRDDGKGFLVEDMMQSPKASGLKNVLKRASMADLDCEVNSLLGEGCTYTLHNKKVSVKSAL